MNREIKERLKSILYTVLFLVGMTWFWYGPRQELNLATADMNRALIHSDVELMSEGEIKLDQTDYEFELKNTKDYEVNYEIIIDNNARKSTEKNCKLVSNNYLAYQLKLDDQYDIIRNLPVNGVIYRGVLASNEVKSYSLKMQVEDENDKNCFSPIIRVSTYDKI